MVSERLARIARPFSAEGEAFTCERHTLSTLLSQTTGCERLVAEAPTFHPPHPNRARLWKRFPVCASICFAIGARTGRALQNGSARSQWQSKCWAIHRRSRGKVRDYHNPFTAEPKKVRRSANPSPTEGSSPMAFHWHRLWLVRSSLAVRAPCAHQRKSKCFAHGKALPKTRRPRAGPRKACENR